MATSSRHGDARPASGRCVGQVRKGVGQNKWSARFQFEVRGKRTTIDAPLCLRRADAERDRKLVVDGLAQVACSLKVETAKAAIANLQSGRRRLPAKKPSSSMKSSRVGFAKLANMKREELRSLATRTPGIMRNKKNVKGKWRSKTKEELKVDLLATQAMPGPIVVLKRPASSAA